MNIELLSLDAQALRTLLMEETKKFLRALEDGSSISDLEGIRMNIREISSILEKKEKKASTDDSSVAA